MAFVHRQPREAPFVTATAPGVGPGSYNTLQKASVNISYAPFGSSEERHVGFEADYNPGPGTYTREKLSATAPVSSQPFVSKVQRFIKPTGTHLSTPGPGTYNFKQSWIKRRAPRRKAKKGANVQWVRVQQAPSIPAPNQSYGYEENKFGELVPQAQPLGSQTHTGVGQDTVGPGYYHQPDPSKFNHRRGPAIDFGRSKVHRTFKLQNSSTPDPGTYFSKPVEKSRRGPVPKSAIFASQVPRIQKKKKKDQTPGPGAYSYQSSLRIAERVPPQFQFFGSSVSRNLGGASNSAASQPGPGSYKVPSAFDKLQDQDDPLHPTDRIGFGSSSSRSTNKKQDCDRGPGSYLNPPNISYDLSRKVFGRCGSFGTTTVRFKKKKDKPRANDTPGPGHYTKKYLLQPPRRTANFASEVKRFQQKPKRAAKKSYVPGPGHYNPGSFVSVPDSHQSAVFKDKVGRFSKPSQLKQVYHTAHLGPGTYQPNLNLSKPNISVNAASVFSSGSRRFGTAPTNTVPGPGTYIDPTARLIKPTFNATIGNDYVR